MKRSAWRTGVVAFGLCLSSAGLARGADKPDGAAKPAKAEKPEEQTFLDPEHAGPDYKLQGEYVGQAGGASWARR